MKFKVLFTKGKGTSGMDLLTFEGFLAIQNINGIKDSLEQNLKSCEALQVKVQKTEKLDLAFLQLLIALKINFKSAEKPICFNLLLDEESDRLLSGSGLGEFLHSKF